VDSNFFTNEEYAKEIPRQMLLDFTAFMTRFARTLYSTPPSGVYPRHPADYHVPLEEEP
jgi:hypothetical protein